MALASPGNLLPYFCPNCLGSGLTVKETASIRCIQQAHFLDIQFIGDQVSVGLHSMILIQAAQGESNFSQWLADFPVGFLAGIVTQRNHFHHQSHFTVERFIDPGLVRFGPGCQVDRFRRFWIHRANQVAIHFLGQERHGRRQQFG